MFRAYLLLGRPAIGSAFIANSAAAAAATKTCQIFSAPTADEFRRKIYVASCHRPRIHMLSTFIAYDTAIVLLRRVCPCLFVSLSGTRPGDVGRQEVAGEGVRYMYLFNALSEREPNLTVLHPLIPCRYLSIYTVSHPLTPR